MKLRNCLSLAPLALGGAILATAPPAAATIIFTTGNQTYTNVNIVAASDVSSCLGDIGNTGFTMTFQDMIGPDGTTQVTMQCEHGVSAVESFADSQPSATHTGFSSITLVAEPNTAWTAGDFSLDQLNSLTSPTGFVTFSGVDQFGNPTSTTLAIDQNGQNPYNFTTANGELVTSILISVPTTDLLQDIKQVSLNAVPIPEPGMLTLVGVGLLGVAVFPLRIGRRADTV